MDTIRVGAGASKGCGEQQGRGQELELELGRKPHDGGRRRAVLVPDCIGRNQLDPGRGLRLRHGAEARKPGTKEIGDISYLWSTTPWLPGAHCTSEIDEGPATPGSRHGRGRRGCGHQLPGPACASMMKPGEFECGRHGWGQRHAGRYYVKDRISVIASACSGRLACRRGRMGG